MSDYSCGNCHKYAGNCTCYSHQRGKEEAIAWEYYQKAYVEAERAFKDYMRGYSTERALGKGGYGYERVPVNTLDLVGMREKVNALSDEYEKVHKQKYEEGKALHEERKVKDREFAAEIKKKAAARERVIERLIEKEMQNEV